MTGGKKISSPEVWEIKNLTQTTTPPPPTPQKANVRPLTTLQSICLVIINVVDTTRTVISYNEYY